MTAEPTAAAGTISPQEAGAIAVEAYIFGYPLVLMDVTCETMTAVSRPQGAHAPVNQFAHVREFPDADFTDVVSPNADTLYSSAVFDLRDEPLVLSVPDIGRSLLPHADARRVHQRLRVAGQAHDGNDGRRLRDHRARLERRTVPDGLQRLDAPTNLAWVIGRTQTNGKADYENVHRFQDGLRLTPLSAWGSDYTPPEVPVRGHVDTGAARRAGRRDGRGDVLQPAGAVDGRQSAGERRRRRAGKIRVDRGRAGWALRPRQARRRTARRTSKRRRSWRRAAIAEAVATPAPDERLVNGWRYLTGAGSYGTDYGVRALVAAFGLGANTRRGRDLSQHAHRRRRSAAQRRAPLPHPLRAGTDAAGERVLVAHDVQRPAGVRRTTRSTATQSATATRSSPTTDGSVELLIQHERAREPTRRTGFPLQRTAST